MRQSHHEGINAPLSNKRRSGRGRGPAHMRRSPPGLSCLMGLDLRKRPLSDLTPEDEEQEPLPRPASVAVDMAPAVEETPSFEHATCKNDNLDVEGKR